MKRKVINWEWENPEAQKSFLKWQGMPNDKETSAEVSMVESILNISAPLKILDIGCGTGRQSIEFSRRGYDVNGIDVAEIYLNQACEKAKELNLNINFELKRGAQIKEKNIYDIAVAYNHTLGLIEDDELKIHFSNIYQSIKHGGKLLLKTAGPQIIPNQIQERKRDWAEQDNQFILSEKYIEDGYRIENCITIDIDKDEIIEYREKQKAFSNNEIIELLSNSGFRKIECYRDLKGNKSTDDEFGVYVCTK